MKYFISSITKFKWDRKAFLPWFLRQVSSKFPHPPSRFLIWKCSEAFYKNRFFSLPSRALRKSSRIFTVRLKAHKIVDALVKLQPQGEAYSHTIPQLVSSISSKRLPKCSSEFIAIAAFAPGKQISALTFWIYLSLQVLGWHLFHKFIWISPRNVN